MAFAHHPRYNPSSLPSSQSSFFPYPAMEPAYNVVPSKHLTPPDVKLTILQFYNLPCFLLFKPVPSSFPPPHVAAASPSQPPNSNCSLNTDDAASAIAVQPKPCPDHHI
ncbi:hypothetical protein M0R45_001375 [Rubus argutus]|uniref:Uncharacterized protein n=1 Tax=Rubus argutus TaxID=59490 RepID=A0AAW1VMD0_RUBAR